MQTSNPPATPTPMVPPVLDPAFASPPKKKRGFACLSPERVREIASRGGIASHQAGTAHQFTSEEAKVHGAKGGRAWHVSRGRAKKA